MNLIDSLLTPNTFITNAFAFLFAFVEGFLFYKLFSFILHLNCNKLQKYFYIACTGIVGGIVNLFKLDYCSDFINIIVFLLLLHFNFHLTIKNICIAIITSYLTIVISSYIATYFFMLFANLSIIDITSIPLYYICTCFLTVLIYLLIYWIIRAKKKLFVFLKFPFRFTIIINLILGIITIAIQTYLISTHADSISFGLTLITIGSLILYFFISMYSLIRTNKLEQTTQDLETEKLYNKTLVHLHDNIRCFKHDFNNIVQSIGGYITLNDMDGLKNYYNHLLIDCQETNNLNILNPETINNPSIYSLLTNKYYTASEKGINMTFNIFCDLSNINCNIYEFTRILGILLDNAIEAAQETSEKNIAIEFKSTSKKQLFIISNSCKDTTISTTKIFEKGYSTKQNNSGIGLWKVHNILVKNTNLDLYTTIKNNTFTQQLEVFYK